MAGRTLYLTLLCVLGLTFSHTFAKPLGDDSDDSFDVDDTDISAIDGDYILNLANETDSALVTLLGRVYKNFERNMSLVTRRTRMEAFLGKLCERNECADWPDWPECPVARGEYSVIYRSRQCGTNTSRCSYPANKTRTETQSMLCLGDRDPDDVVKTTSRQATARPPIKTSPAIAATISCPEAYDPVGSFCMQLVTSFRLAHGMASTLCQWDGGSLLNVDTADKRAALVDLLYEKNFVGELWLDGKRDSEESEFYYTDDVTPEVNMWEFGEPAEDFPVMGESICRVHRALNQTWTAYPCDSTEHHFVCEIFV